jgi:archaellum component FlaF (FlaF/FlaG flagellin family)
LIVAIADKEGTAEDPLIAKSYLDEVFTPQIMAVVDEAVKEIEDGYVGEIETLIAEYTAEIDQKISELNEQTGQIVSNEAFVAMLEAKLMEKVASVSVQPSSDGQTFKVITLQNGQRVVGGIGCEIMLRVGSAVASGNSDPVLIDLVHNTTVASGTALVKNYLYVVTINNQNGFTATADNTKVLIRGTYTIG